MAANDVRIYDDSYAQGSEKHNVAAAATAILSGEPVVAALGAPTVTAAADNSPIVGTTYLVGISAGSSTQTAAAAGTVEVYPIVDGATWVAAAKDATAVNTQAKYDALVGDRCGFDLTTGNYTVDTTDGATNGLVIMPMDISRYPGCVRFAIRRAASYTA